MKVHIIGAGVAGLATAAALARQGHGVTVFEQAPALTEVGAGLQISANGRRVLDWLGVTPEGGVLSEGVRIVDGKADRLVTEVAADDRLPTLLLHRMDLVAGLERAARDYGVELRFGQQIDAAGIATLGQQADLLVGADGVKSPLRQVIDGPSEPRFTGQVAWRALVPNRAGDERVTLALGPGAHVVSYPLRGGTITNIVAIEERRDWQEEGWALRGEADELRNRFAWFGGQTRALLDRVEEVHRWALFLHPVADRWHHDRSVLVGDAAHPTLPFLAQGANLALEDAAVLACVLDNTTPLVRRLETYQRHRKDRAAQIVRDAALNGTKFHFPGPLRLMAQMVLRYAGPLVTPNLDWIYGYDATRV